MKPIQLLFGGLLVMQVLACGAQNNRTSISNHNGETEIRIENDKEDVALSYKGEISLSDDETSIKALTPGTRLRFRDGSNKLEVVSDASGTLQYRCNGGEATAAPSGECASLVRGAIDLVIRSGVNAKERTARIYTKSGTAGVLKEVARLNGDWVRSLYLKQLMEQPSLPASDWTAIAGSVKTIQSDYEKAGLLKKLVAQSANAASMPAFFDAAATVGSDYEKAGVLSAAFTPKLDASYYPRLISVAGTIHSDYERGRVLKKAAETPGMPFAPLLSAAGTMGSDYEKANVLKKLTSLAGTDEANWIALFGAAKTINSDYEKSNVLINAAKSMPRSEKVLAEYRKAAQSIQSEYELGRAMKALGTQA